MDCPPISIEPALTGSSPASIINSVLFPQPEGPRIEMNCRSATSMLMLHKTSIVPPSTRKLLPTLLSRTNAWPDCALQADMRWPQTPFRA
jgi:hypothetical protein